MASIADNIRRIRDRLRALETQYRRPPGSVELLAVSKTHPAALIREAFDAGQHAFGENYVQEALDKMDELALPQIVWHFIGPLQSNKTRDVAARFHWVHSVDRLRIAQRLSGQRPADLPPLNVLVQVNISGEASKSGVAPDEVDALCDAVAALPGIRLRGLMAIPAPGRDLEAQRRVYRPLAGQFEALRQRHATVDTLSAGMSDDHEAAIAEGSTLVRMGTALFGQRRPAAAD